MSRESYFSQYVSPNIVIVPTVSFSPPESDVKADPITNPLNCEQTRPKDYYSDLAPTETYFYKENVTSADMNFSPKAVESTRASDDIQISPVKRQSTISTKVPSYHTSPSIKELSTAQYKSRNSLVDFTGFNKPKWDRGNRYIDSRRRDTYYESDTMKSNRETEYRKSSERYTRKSDDVVVKERSKSVKPISSQSKLKAESIAINEIKKIESDMTEKMKKCFKQLWKRNVEKLKAKSAKEKREKLKLSKEHSKSLKPESVRSKSHLQGVTKNTSSKNIKNKTTDKAKKNYDLERSNTSEKSKRSRSETNTTLTSDSKEIKDRKAYLSPISMKRYKDFQQFIRQNDDDDENKNNTEHNDEKKTDQVYKKKIRMKSCETITKTKSDIKTKVIERKQVVKKETTKKERHTEVTHTTQNKMERVKPIKSVIQVNNLSQGKFANVEEDLRVRLSRKRTKSEYETNSTLEQSGDTKTDQDKEKIRLNQDAKADTKISKVDKPKKNKKMKLIIINIECPDSDNSEDSDQNSNECSASPQDLSFLDDINVDEIVNSLNDGQTQVIEQNMNKLSAANTMFLIKDKTNEHDHKNKCNEYTGIEDSINIDDKKKTIKIKKEKIKACEEVISIDSDSGDGDSNVKNGSSAKEKLEKEQVVKTSSRIDKNNKRRSSKITEPTIKQVEKDVQQNRDTNETKTSVSEIKTEDDNKDKSSEHSSMTKNVKELKSNKNESKVDQILELLTRSTKKRLTTEITNKSQSTTSTNGIKKSKSCYKRKDENRQNNAVRNHSERKLDDNNEKLNSSKKAATEAKMDQRKGDPIEASLVSIFSPINDVTNINGVTAQPVLSSICKNIKTENMQEHNSSDPKCPIEASLETMFSGRKENVSGKQIHNEPFNKSVNKIKDNLHGSSDRVETSLSTMFSDNKQLAVINRVIEEPNLSEKDIKNEAFDNMNHMIDLNANIRAELKNVDRPEITPKTTENNIVEKSATETNSDPSSRSNVSPQKVVNTLQKSLASEENKLDKKGVQKTNTKQLSQSDEKVNKASNAQKTLKESQRTPTKGIENKTNPVVKPPENTGKSTQNVKHIVHKKSTSHTVKPQSSLNQNNKPTELSKPKESIKKPQEISSKNCGKTAAKTDIKSFENRDKLKNNIKENGQTSNQQKTVNDHTAKDKGLTNTNKKDTKGEVKHLQKPINKERQDTTIPCEKKKPSNIKDKQVQNKPETNVTKNPENLQKITRTDIKPVEKTVSATKEVNLAEKPSDKSHMSSEPEARTSDSNVNKTVASSNNVEQDVKKNNESQVNDTKTTLKVKDITQKLEEVKNSIQPKNGNATHEGMLKNDNTNKGINLSGTNSAADVKTNNDKITKTSVKPAIADSKNKSSETNKNDTQKPGTSNNMSKANSAANKVPNKTSEVIKRAENVPNSNKKQEAKINKVAEDRQKKVDKERKLETKPDNTEVKSGFAASVEIELFHNLNTRTELTSKIQNGRFSVIHKCSDSNGKTYALKVMRVPAHHIGPHIENMLFGLQENFSTQDSCILHLICSFEVQNQYCLLTEFYPKNLAQALQENQRGFHINLVQVLSKQLVDALHMLSDHNILHADIKPGHILLNNRHDKLKLCGFDRSGYYDSIKIYPSTGTLSYRAPEIILGFPEYLRIDVWSAACVMFKMATNTDLFTGKYNNEMLYQHLCTLGSFDWTMIEESKFSFYYFEDTSFKLKTGPGRNDMMLVHVFHESDRLRQQLFSTYTMHWARSRTRWQMTNDLDKLEMLHSLLEQMLDLDPRHRLPMQFVAVSEFLNNFSTRNF